MSEQLDDLRPWEPMRFEVGQRVKVRLNGECRIPHRSQSQGRSGLITAIKARGDGSAAPYYFGHPYKVTYDVPFPAIEESEGWRVISSMFAGAELEPLDELAP